VLISSSEEPTLIKKDEVVNFSLTSQISGQFQTSASTDFDSVLFFFSALSQSGIG
jgi:hypothetical protein